MVLSFNIGFLRVSFVDLLDISLLSLLFYAFYHLMKGTVAIKVLIGFGLLNFIYLLVKVTGLELLTIALSQFLGLGLIVIIVIFQQELRKFLFLLGGTTVIHPSSIWGRFFSKEKERFDVTPVIEAAKFLGSTNTGALIIFSKNDDLRSYEESGDIIDAVISKRMLVTIFNKLSPLHDGGVIIRNGRIIAARCILPVTEQQNLPPQFGLRHRSAIGLTEVTNSLVLIVSEETGQISVAKEGKILKNLSAQEVRGVINQYLAS